MASQGFHTGLGGVAQPNIYQQIFSLTDDGLFHAYDMSAPRFLKIPFPHIVSARVPPEQAGSAIELVVQGSGGVRRTVRIRIDDDGVNGTTGTEKTALFLQRLNRAREAYAARNPGAGHIDEATRPSFGLNR